MSRLIVLVIIALFALSIVRANDCLDEKLKTGPCQSSDTSCQNNYQTYQVCALSCIDKNKDDKDKAKTCVYVCAVNDQLKKFTDDLFECSNSSKLSGIFALICGLIILLF